jgi:hypothetical protein
MDFVDLQGASGRVYRFRRWPAAGEHPPIAGNYALLRLTDQEIVTLGVSENLAAERDALSRFGVGFDAFTRLNVARSHREAEDADLRAAYPHSASAAA